MKVYKKLVRDRIPDIMAQNGEQAHFSVLNDEDYLRELDKSSPRRQPSIRRVRNLRSWPTFWRFGGNLHSTRPFC